MAEGFDGTALLAVPSTELPAALERSVGEGTFKRLLALRSALIYRVLDCLRSSTRSEMHDEAIAIEKFLASKTGRKLAETNAAELGGWSALASLLSEAANRSDAEAVEMILRSHSKYGRRLLELLAESDVAVPRTELLKKLDISQSQLSHLLRDFEEADLIQRSRSEGHKEVMVSLGPVGREYVERALVPRFVQVIEDCFAALKSGAPRSAADIERELLDKGVPSALAAERLAAALSTTVPLEKAIAFTTQVTGRDAHARLQIEANAGKSPVAGFGRVSYA